MNQGNQLIKLVLEELETNKGSWKINSRKQYTRIKIGEEGIGKHKKEHIKDKFREIDTKEWREEMEKRMEWMDGCSGIMSGMEREMG